MSLTDTQILDTEVSYTYQASFSRHPRAGDPSEHRPAVPPLYRADIVRTEVIYTRGGTIVRDKRRPLGDAITPEELAKLKTLKGKAFAQLWEQLEPAPEPEPTGADLDAIQSIIAKAPVTGPIAPADEAEPDAEPVNKPRKPRGN